MTLETAALILAGGQSRRMGQDKALLPMPVGRFGQITLLEHTCHIAQGCTSRVYVLTSWPQRYNGLLSPTVTLLRETQAGAGPLVALLQGWSMILAAAQGERPPDWLMVLACDLPALTGNTFKTWQRNLLTVREDAIAALPRHHDRWEPLCGFYHRRCIPSLQTAIQNNIRSFQQWLASEVVIPLPIADFNMLQNCNTPVEWQQFLNSTKTRNP